LRPFYLPFGFFFPFLPPQAIILLLSRGIKKALPIGNTRHEKTTGRLTGGFAIQLLHFRPSLLFHRNSCNEIHDLSLLLGALE
jgi:hypothetical protein